MEERDLGGTWTVSEVRAGDFFLTRSPTAYEMRWQAHGSEPFHVMHLYLSVPMLDEVARELCGPDAGDVALQEISGGHDEVLSEALSLVHRELIGEGEASRLYIRGLAQVLAVHLARRYAARSAETRRPSALPRAKLQRASAHMALHLHEPFDLGCLAHAVGMSEFHFSRLFKNATGVSPSRYFIRHRVAKARQLLQETDASVLEIGMSVGYANPSHFAQVFRRETGVSPRDYRRR